MCLSKDPYVLDLDSNGFLAMTEKNARFLCASIKLDSAYRKTYDKNDDNSAFKYAVDHNKEIMDKEVMTEICRRIDRENSTHLSVSGNQKGDNKGISNTVDIILGIDDIVVKLQNGNADLVKTIAGYDEKEANLCEKKRNNFSFASKFCTYMCRFLFEGSPESDNYSIYDGVLSRILPYYAWYYCDDETYITKRGNSGIEKVFKDKYNYEGYRDLIDRIRQKIEDKMKFPITREQFDSMLWYYYKGMGEKEMHRALNVKGLKKLNG